MTNGVAAPQSHDNELHKVLQMTCSFTSLLVYVFT